MGVIEVDDAGHVAVGIAGGHAEEIDATRDDGLEYNVEPDAQQWTDQGNGDCDDGVHQEVKNGIHELVNDAGYEARGGGGEGGEMKQPISSEGIVQMSKLWNSRVRRRKEQW